MSISQADIESSVGEVPSSTPPSPAPATGKPRTVPPALKRSTTGPQQDGSRQPDINRILKLPVSLTVTLAERYMSVRSITEITVGTIIEFDVPFDSELTLQVCDQTIARGQAVKVGERFGLRISRIGTVQDRVDALGGA